jgi:hypothetical protein
MQAPAGLATISENTNLLVFEVIALRVLSALAAAALAALVTILPLDAASAHAVGGCPTPAGFAPVQFGDIPEIDRALFDHFDINGDGTICARPYSALPNGGPPKKAGGVAVDNTVVGLAH